MLLVSTIPAAGGRAVVSLSLQFAFLHNKVRTYRRSGGGIPWEFRVGWERSGFQVPGFAFAAVL